MRAQAPPLPRAFLWRRLHSLAGLFLVLYIIEHLLTNSQAALWLGDDGQGFIRAVNAIRDLPYLYLIEIFILGVPILVHMAWGIAYLRTGFSNSYPSDGTKPALNFSRNQAYTWQRITSWVLFVGIIAHVVHMRIIEFPEEVPGGYKIEVSDDAGLKSLSKRLDFEIKKGKPGKVAVIAKDFGTADLLMLRNTFKSPIMILLYTLFVLTACFHGFNGLWTAMITWGITLTERSQLWMRRLSTFLMALVGAMGLAAVWLTYWNLRV